MSRGFASNYRIVLLATGLFACFAGLAGRLVWLHVVDRDDLLKSVAKVRSKLITDEARRGDILDTRGNILATSRSLVVLGFDPTALRAADAGKWPQLAALIGMPSEKLQEILSAKYVVNPAASVPPAADRASAPPPSIDLKLGFLASADASAKETSAEASEDLPSVDTETDLPPPPPKPKKYVKLSENITESTYAQIEKLGIVGIVGERSYRRAYPHGKLAAHIIGYVNNVGQPATGIERGMNFFLRGQNGWHESEKDALGRELAQFRFREILRADGYSVVLSIDSYVQDLIELELEDIARRLQPEKATIIVSAPRTGFILAMANYPTFDLNEYGKVPKEAQASMKNIAITDILEPGSTFKIVSVAAALDEGVITPSDRFDCNLVIADYQNKPLKLPKDDHHYDHDLTIAEIVAHSSNRGAAQIGMRLGKQRLYDYARAFGFGRKLGFPTGGEVVGILAPPEKWDGIAITRIPMGHTISATALQMHQAMCTIATGGVLLQPQVVKQIKDANGEAVIRYERVEIGRAVSENTAHIMAKMLMGVASKEGTAPEAAIPGYEVAGKTGTTQMLLTVTDAKGNRKQEYTDKHHIGSFVGFFPASNPQVAITVVVHDADARLPGGWGAKVAAPSFKRIGEKLISYWNIPPPPPAALQRNTFAAQGLRR